MLIKRIMLVAILATITNAAFGADLVDMGFVNQAAGEYGPQNNAITEAALNRILEECKKVTDWNDASQLPLSSILRAQLSNDTTSAQLGNSEAFRRLFPVNGAEIAQEFKKLVAADSTQDSRNNAINTIMELKAAAPAKVEVPAGGAAKAMNPALAALREKIIGQTWDRSGKETGVYEINLLGDVDFANWKSTVTSGCSPMILAIILKDVDAVRELINVGANVNEVACDLLPLQAAKQFAAGTGIPEILEAAGATL